MKCFDQLIKSNIFNLDTWYYKAQLLIKLVDYKNALKYLDEASNLNPDDERVWEDYKKTKSLNQYS